MPRRLSFQLASLMFACGLVARAQAAELGDIKVNSFIGQHLSADIELTSLEDAAGQVQVRLASLDVYRGANLDMPAVLANVNLSVMRRDGKQFLHVTSTRPVDADHLHLYLELADGNRKGVRLATLWFAPDPSPPPPPERVAIPMTTPGASASAGSGRKSQPIRPLPQSSGLHAKVEASQSAVVWQKVTEPGEPAPKAAAPAKAVSKPGAAAAQVSTPATPEAPVAKPAAAAEPPKSPMPSEPSAKPATPGGEGAKPGVSTSPEAKPLASAKPAAPPLPWAQGQPARPAPLKLAKAPAAPACRKQPSEAESTCAALDNKNAELRAEIGKLEARVNSLLAHQNSRQAEVSKATAQLAVLQVPQQAQAPAVQESPGQTASGKVTPMPPPSRLGPKRASSKKPPAPQASEVPSAMPWGWIAGAGAAVFALIGGLQFWRHRRKRPKSSTVHAPLPDEDESPVEPTLG